MSLLFEFCFRVWDRLWARWGGTSTRVLYRERFLVLFPFFFPSFSFSFSFADSVFTSYHEPGRVLYTLGYTTGEPAKRNTQGGALHFVGYLGEPLDSLFFPAMFVGCC